MVKNKEKEGGGKEIEEFMKEKLKEMMDKIYLPMIFEKTGLICKEVFMEFFNSKKIVSFMIILSIKHHIKNKLFK